jgi:hypothetical protein
VGEQVGKVWEGVLVGRALSRSGCLCRVRCAPATAANGQMCMAVGGAGQAESGRGRLDRGAWAGRVWATQPGATATWAVRIHAAHTRLEQSRGAMDWGEVARQVGHNDVE